MQFVDEIQKLTAKRQIVHYINFDVFTMNHILY